LIHPLQAVAQKGPVVKSTGPFDHLVSGLLELDRMVSSST